jgi:hypothetical protein
MFVYGIRAAPSDLPSIPTSHGPAPPADYYMDYGLLVFPNYTRPACLKNHGGVLTSRFWTAAARLITQANRPHEVEMEDPYLTDDEGAVIAAIQEAHPSAGPTWYSVPQAVWTPPSDRPTIRVSDLP